MMDYLGRMEKIALGSAVTLILAITADAGIGLYNIEKKLDGVRSLQTNTLEESVDTVADRLPENWRTDFRRMNVYVGGRGAVPHISMHGAECNPEKIFIYTPGLYPQIIAHEFGHYVFECKLDESQLPEIRNALDASGLTGIKTKRRYSEAFAEMYRRHVFDPDSIKPEEKAVESAVVRAMNWK